MRSAWMASRNRAPTKAPWDNSSASVARRTVTSSRMPASALRPSRVSSRARHTSQRSPPSARRMRNSTSKPVRPPFSAERQASMTRQRSSGCTKRASQARRRRAWSVQSKWPNGPAGVQMPTPAASATCSMRRPSAWARRRASICSLWSSSTPDSASTRPLSSRSATRRVSRCR